ncbi:MAG TPA: preprotein translocase subunit YajC [Clostridiales bacterium]|nr:preprotein translocase subunit YajC [Clostridiales bacterium]
MFIYVLNTTTADAATNVSPTSSLLTMVLPLALMFGLMYLLLIRPQKKKEKKLREQINAMVVGDSIVTIGGVVGRIVNIKDDEVTITTSAANSLITFKKSAISTVVKPISD